MRVRWGCTYVIEELGACLPTAGRGGVCDYIPQGIGRGGVIPSGIGAIDFLRGVLFVSYKPGTSQALRAQRTVGLDIQVGRTAPIAFELDNSQSSSLTPRDCGVIPRTSS